MANNISRRLVFGGAGGLTISLVAPRSPRAAFYPERPVKIVTGFAPGGPADVLARILAAHLGKVMGGTFIVENHPGAAGNLGCGYVARAAADGYTLLIHTSALVINPSLYKKVPYDVVQDFTPLVELATSPNIFFTSPATGMKTIADVVARAKAAPTALSFASPGIGTPPHLSGEMLKIKAGIQMTHVPYNGGGPCVEAVLQNTTSLGCNAMPPTLPLIASGQLVPLAVTWRTRWPTLPDVPTMVEAGYPGFVTDAFFAFMAPAQLPQAIQDALVKATQSILNDPPVRQLLFTDGFEVLANGPAGMAKRISDELPMWRELIAKAGIERV
jgi:tripartite-type tricarboxylate transporter receptor subunit TctC